MINKRVPEAVIRRLPKYYIKLCELESQGVIRISSLQLSQQMGLNASQIRQDLNYFGGFGQQGYGYMVDNLRKNLGEILGLHEETQMVIVGCGHIGLGLARYEGFHNRGFKIVKMFDTNEKIIGTTINGIEICDVHTLKDFLEKESIDIGVIAVPKSKAQKIADIFIECNVKGIWNFAPCDISAPNAVVEDVRLDNSLLALKYKIINEIYD